MLDRPRRQRLARRVDRAQAVRARRGRASLGDIAPLRVHEVEVSALEARLALDDALPPGVQLAPHPGHVEEDHTGGARSVTYRGLEPRALPEGGAARHHRRPDRDVRRLLRVRLRFERRDMRRDRVLAMLLLDAEGEVADEVTDRADPELVEMPSARGARADGALDRIEAGESFADVASDVSTDTSAEAGGILSNNQTGDECFPFDEIVEQIVEQIALVIPDTRPGEVTGPIEVPEVGWVAVVLRPFAEVASEAERVIGPVTASRIANSSLDSAKIWINPGYGRWDSDSRQVVADQ